MTNEQAKTDSNKKADAEEQPEATPVAPVQAAPPPPAGEKRD